MTRSRFATPRSPVLLICLLAIAGCHANDPAPQASFSGAGRYVISDGTHNEGTPGFYFLPPIVPGPGNFGPFRPDVFPTVQIDQVTLSPAGCTSDCDATVVRANVAYWTRFWGSDWRRIRVHLTSSWGGWRGWNDDDDGDDGDDGVPEGYFVVRWDSDDFGVAVRGIYRVRVMVPSNGDQLELGFADIEIVANKKQFRNVNTTEYVPLIDGRTLKIKFRIDTPALACVDVTCPSGGECDPQTGQCTNPLPPEGSACADDGNPCTRDVYDAAGQCVHPAGNAGTQCRAAAGQCDLAAFCDGVSSACPANAFQPQTTVCRASAGACDAAETCTGSSAFCPPDQKAAVTTVCRPASGACEAPASCDGVSNDCPTNAFLPPTTVCRPAQGACDAAETCTGASEICPPDDKVPAATVCRPAAGACESAALCDGVSSDCPMNAFLPPTSVCRPSQGACDVEETCTGDSASCPADGKAVSGTICRLAQGDCDLPASCDGARDECPANGFKPADVVCRGAAGTCDVAETCTGATAFCPLDLKVAAGTVCRPSAGQCDAAETCDGSSNGCAADVFQPDGTACELAACSPEPFVCRANACVPSLTQCPPGFNDGGDGTCLPSGPTVCALDDFNGTGLDAHWNSSAVGSAPALAVGESFLHITDAALAPTPSFGGSWIYNANFDRGNQMAWPQAIGTNDFDVKFSFAWDSTTGKATMAGIGLTNASNQLELRAGLEAPGDVGVPEALLRNVMDPMAPETGFVGNNEEAGSADMRLTRSGGVLTIEFRGAQVFCAPFAADIRNLVIYTVHGQFLGVDYPFGEFDVDSVSVCRPTLTCAPGYVDLGNARCEKAVSSG